MTSCSIPPDPAQGMMKLLTLVVGRFAGNGGGAPTPEQILQATREAAAAMGPNNGMAAAMSQLQGDVGSELLARARLELSQAMAQDVAQVTPGSSRSPELLPASGKVSVMGRPGWWSIMNSSAESAVVSLCRPPCFWLQPVSLLIPLLLHHACAGPGLRDPC